MLALVAVLAAPALARTLYVDGGCVGSGTGASLSCGPTGPLRTVNEALVVAAPLAGIESVTVQVRGAHGAFDGAYHEYVKLWGARALPCTSAAPCVIEGCPAAVCGTDETPVISGFVTPTDGWSVAGSGANTVFARQVAARGHDGDWGGGDLLQVQEPPDAYFGTGAGVYNPVYLLEGAARTALGYGGSCDGDFATPCATSAQCDDAATCDVTAPPDGFWTFACTGNPVTACTIRVNPHGSGDPRAGHPIWIPNRNALVVADGRTECPQQEAGCPAASYLTLRRFAIEGTRWLAVNLQNNDLNESEHVRLEQLTVRYAPRFAIRVQRINYLVIDGLVMEEAGRGMSFDTGGTFGLRLLGVRQGDFSNVVARHFGNAGRRDTQLDGVGGALRSCAHCDPPWNSPSASVWGPPCDAFDLKQSSGLRMSDFEVTDIAGGLRIDSSINTRLERGLIRRTQTGLIVNQLTPSAAEGFVRSYNIILRQLRLDQNGDKLRGAINLGSNVGGDQVCLTPPQKDEYFRIYDNMISRSGLAGILVCENTKRCQGGGYELGGCTTDADCPGGACVEADGTGQVAIYNNTIWEDRPGFSSAGILVRNGLVPDGTPALAYLDVRNNLISAVTGAAVEIPSGTIERNGVTLDANLYHDPDGDRACVVRWGDTCFQTLSAVRAATPAEPLGIEDDPAFTDLSVTPADLHIGVSSPARDAGVSLGADYAKDFDRQTRGEKWDIGADEFRCGGDADCDDGNQCNGEERCFSGFCGAAPAALVCDDQNICTADSCKPATGCQYKPVTDGTGCDDADACTPVSSCQTGQCVGTDATVCPPTGICRLQAGCDPDTGACLVSPPAPDGAACDDGDACTTGDACRTGACAGRRCDGDPCTQCTLTGCQPMAAGTFEAVTCAYRRSLAPAACNGQRLPVVITEHYADALTILERVGASGACDRGRKNVYGRAGVRIIKALRKLDQTQRRRSRQQITSECFSALRSVLSDARRRAQAASALCTSG